MQTTQLSSLRVRVGRKQKRQEEKEIKKKLIIKVRQNVERKERQKEKRKLRKNKLISWVRDRACRCSAFGCGLGCARSSFEVLALFVVVLCEVMTCCTFYVSSYTNIKINESERFDRIVAHVIACLEYVGETVGNIFIRRPLERKEWKLVSMLFRKESRDCGVLRVAGLVFATKEHYLIDSANIVESVGL